MLAVIEAQRIKKLYAVKSWRQGFRKQRKSTPLTFEYQVVSLRSRCFHTRNPLAAQHLARSINSENL